MIAEQQPVQGRTTAASGKPSPEETLIDIAHAYVLSRSLHVVTELGVADALGEAPSTAAQLAAVVGADADALHRVMRLLAGHGIFAARDGGFAHTSASRLLRVDHPSSLRAMIRGVGSPIVRETSGALRHSVRTGQPAATQVHPGGLSAYLAENPEAGATFNAAMSAKAQAQITGVLESYDFSKFATIGDIGGGLGHLLRAILDQTPSSRGVLFDLPAVIEEARRLPVDRLTLQQGDFFKDALPVCDLYLLMEVIHDWPDEDAITLLRAVRRVSPPHARLPIIERMVSEEPGPDFVKLLDIGMLVLVGGRQRSRREYIWLLERSGFAFEREIDPPPDMAILEATPC